MSGRTVIPLNLPQIDTGAGSDEDRSDESSPLSPTPEQTKSYGAALPVARPQKQEIAQSSTDEIDPFTFEPPFKLWHKVLVGVCELQDCLVVVLVACGRGILAGESAE